MNDNILFKQIDDVTKKVTIYIKKGQTIDYKPENGYQHEIIEAHNPCLNGLYADPDIRYFDDTFYIYPTSDGFPGWSGTKFHVFSSKDMINWRDEGVILDVASDDVSWSIGSAWAPCIEKKNNQYYYYFCAKREDGASCIGVATSSNPTGPFKALNHPLITPEIAKKEGIRMGQTIDPSIFTDDDGRSYMYFGNGDMAVVELNEDMISFKTGAMKNIQGGIDFRESVIVTKRDGIYHFTWSCDDTGSPNYHVKYGISDNIYGPIDYKHIILSKNTALNLLGTGHHSILQLPNDTYYIAYHRFALPLEKYPHGKGFHRETCLEKLEFDENGYMKVIEPTLKGITHPVKVK